MFNSLITNKERVLAQIIQSGPLHRADLARILGVSRTTLTNLAQSLIESGILAEEESDGIKTKLYLPKRLGVMLSVAFSIRHTAMLLTALDGRVLGSKVQSVEPHETGFRRYSAARSVLIDLLEGLGTPPIAAVHIAVNTQVDTRSGAVLGAQASRMWQGMNPLEGFAVIAKEAPILVENTARLMGLVQSRVTNHQLNNFVYVDLSYGVTLGHIVNGQIAHGSHGGAGELGHVSIDPNGLPCECGNRGCLMQYVGEEAVMRRAKMLRSAPDSIEALIAAGSDPQSQGFDHAAVSLQTDLGESLGQALVVVCHILDPDVIMLGGKLAASEQFVAAARRVVLQRALPLTTSNIEICAASQLDHELQTVQAGIDVLRGSEDVVYRCIRMLLQH